METGSLWGHTVFAQEWDGHAMELDGHAMELDGHAMRRNADATAAGAARDTETGATARRGCAAQPPSGVSRAAAAVAGSAFRPRPVQ